MYIQPFCPISLLILASKLLESAINFQLSPIINCSFGPFQSGFRPAHSTESALISVSSVVLYQFLKFVLPVLFDTSAAFDLVDHCISLDDLSFLGLSSSAFSLFRSHLSDRWFSVFYTPQLLIASNLLPVFLRTLSLVLFSSTSTCLHSAQFFLNSQSSSKYMQFIYNLSSCCDFFIPRFWPTSLLKSHPGAPPTKIPSEQ